MTSRRHVLKMLGGAAAGLCPTCLSVTSAFAAKKKAASSHGAVPKAAKPHGEAPSWGYEDGAAGPENWGDLTPANRVCGVGFQQSPVDLAQGLEAQLGGIYIDYKPMPLSVLNNGHTIQVNCEAGSKIQLDGKPYKLLQYHFHHPSEHALEGKRFELEAHFVHIGEDGTLAVLGVFFLPGQENEALGNVWSSMPQKSGEVVKGGNMSPSLLLPENPAYYRYFGSLTTPPCSEKVIWTVYSEPLQASTSQVQEFARLFPMNARPLQRQNRRHFLKTS